MKVMVAQHGFKGWPQLLAETQGLQRLRAPINQVAHSNQLILLWRERHLLKQALQWL
jgi:hypothetical protein